ncbi:MAG: hypothetical protein AB8B93_02630 [Pseudomonadales bacterium]
MPRFALSPYYHPTTVCFVDDNQSFLNSLELEMPEEWSYRGFVEPGLALQFLQQPPKLAPLVDRCFAFEKHDHEGPIIHLKLGTIEQEINHIARFERVSVAVIDYAMPLMSGLELCAAIDDRYMQKAMLTGVADEQVAVAAFNDGLIDRFAAKHKLSSAQEILAFVGHLQQVFFNQYTTRLRDTLAMDPPQFLLDEAIAIRVRQLMRDRSLIEYYLVDDPPGLLLLNAAGELFRLLILSVEQLAMQVAFAEQNAAPAAIVERLRSGHCVGYFWDTPAHYFGNEPFPWEEHLLPATTLAGTQKWYLALAEDPPTDIDFDPQQSSFNAYLRQRGER